MPLLGGDIQNLDYQQCACHGNWCCMKCRELPASYTMSCEPFWQRPCLCNASGEACMEAVHTPQRSCSTP